MQRDELLAKIRASIRRIASVEDQMKEITEYIDEAMASVDYTAFINGQEDGYAMGYDDGYARGLGYGDKDDAN